MLDDHKEFRTRVSWGFNDEELPRTVDRDRVTWSGTWWSIVFGIAGLAAFTLAFID